MSLFLPYHETPHFIKMVSILNIKYVLLPPRARFPWLNDFTRDRSPLRFLQAYKTTATPLHRSLLITEMLKTLEVARFVSHILPTTLQSHCAGVHRALITFHTGLLLEFVARSKALDENAMAVLLPAALEPLENASNPDAAVKATLLQESIVRRPFATCRLSLLM